MENTLFNPNRIDLPKSLVLVPQFWNKSYYHQIKNEALASLNFLLSDILIFPNYAVIEGFLGYPHILTTLEFIRDVREKDVYFLGTAGSLNHAIDRPIPLQVEAIYSTEILDHFCTETFFPLKTIDAWNCRKARGVTVDIIQRETPQWLKAQVERGMDFVEMELFPLRVYLGKPFSAVVIASDLLKESGIEVFKDKGMLQHEFVKAYEAIVEQLR
ncbi:MAG: hypothetical protein ACM3SY_09935 [Candidatus Omnitrophota bacterium]